MRVSPLFPILFLSLSASAFGQEAEHAYTTSGIYAENQQVQNDPPRDSAPGALIANTVTYRPLTTKQKFFRSTKGTFGPVALAFDAVGAGYEQLTNSPSPWEQGGEGYAKRFASTFGINFVNQYSEFILGSALHEDPRYFPSTDRSAKARIKSALKQTFISKTDSGRERFAYSKIGGAFAGGFAANAWLPHTDNSVASGFETTAVLIGLNTAFNIAQEFVPLFRHIQ